MSRRLRLSFPEPAAFRREFEQNIAEGGAFVATKEGYDLREVVEVELDLAFQGESLVLEAEVVHVVTPEMGGDAGAGVAVQFLTPASELRERLAPLANSGAAPPEGDPLAAVSDRRRAPRAPARVAAGLRSARVQVDGVTRDLSAAGTLVSADGTELSVGEEVRVALRHPETSEPLELRGRVSRTVDGDGTVAAVGIDFEDAGENEDWLESFVGDAKRAEADRVTSGISGVIQELGMPSLIQMLAGSSQQGTLTVRCRAEEGVLAFEGNVLRYSRVGSLRGQKALVRMLSWTEGTFHFHAEVDPLDDEEPRSLNSALLDGVRELDEAGRYASDLSPGTSFEVDRDGVAASTDLAKTETAVLELAGVGSTLRRILDVIPESDADILAAVQSLLERSLLRPRS